MTQRERAFVAAWVLFSLALLVQWVWSVFSRLLGK